MRASTRSPCWRRVESNFATNLATIAVSGGRLIVFGAVLSFALSCAAAQSVSRKNRKQASKKNRAGFMGDRHLRVLLFCTRAILRAINRRLLLKSLRVLWLTGMASIP